MLIFSHCTLLWTLLHVTVVTASFTRSYIFGVNIIIKNTQKNKLDSIMWRLSSFPLSGMSWLSPNIKTNKSKTNKQTNRQAIKKPKKKTKQNKANTSYHHKPNTTVALRFRGSCFPYCRCSLSYKSLQKHARIYKSMRERHRHKRKKKKTKKTHAFCRCQTPFLKN